MDQRGNIATENKYASTYTIATTTDDDDHFNFMSFDDSIHKQSYKQAELLSVAC